MKLVTSAYVTRIGVWRLGFMFHCVAAYVSTAVFGPILEIYTISVFH